MTAIDLDAVVVGAGIAGSAAAWFLAERGLRVALVDARSFAEAGPRWINDVPPGLFDAAGVPRPEPPERHADGGAFTLLAPSGARALTVDPRPVIGVDMRRLGARLVAAGAQAGVAGYEGARVVDLELEAGRPRALLLKTSAGAHRLRAALFVDASGYKAVLRRRVPALQRDCVTPARTHLCSAAQGVFEIADRYGAEAFLARHEARRGETLCRTGVSGGFSIANVCVAPEGDEVDLLTGAIATAAWRSGPDLLEGVRQRERWIGRRRFGGGGVIPLRRPYDRLGAPGIALLGDAACQVFPAHGSGIGVGMVAARLLADAVAEADDPGGLEAIWRYQAGFHRSWGGLLAAYDVFRRLSQRLTAYDLEVLLRGGLLPPFGVRAALLERMPWPRLEEAWCAASATLRQPRAGARMWPALAAMAPLRVLYRRYPIRPDERALARWSRAVAAVFREPPDVGP